MTIRTRTPLGIFAVGFAAATCLACEATPTKDGTAPAAPGDPSVTAEPGGSDDPGMPPVATPGNGEGAGEGSAGAPPGPMGTTPDPAGAAGAGTGGAPPMTDPPETPDTPALKQPLAVGPFSTCVIDAENSVECFGRCGTEGRNGSRAKAPAGLKARSVAVGVDFACALLAEAANGSEVMCWGKELGAPAPALTGAVELVAGDEHACVRAGDGAVTCWGVAEHAAPAGLVAKELAASGAMTCAIRSDDAVQCWGPNVAEPPAGLTAQNIAVSSQLADAQAGPRFGCAVSLEGAVSCWGDNRGSVQTVPEGLVAKQVATGRSAACAIAMDDTVSCWGEMPGFGQAMPAGQKASHLAMRFRTTGAISDADKFVFWGDTRDGRGEPSPRVIAPKGACK